MMHFMEKHPGFIVTNVGVDLMYLRICVNTFCFQIGLDVAIVMEIQFASI